MDIQKLRKVLVPGTRVTFFTMVRGQCNFGFGDVLFVNRKTIDVVDRKFPGEATIRVHFAQVTGVVDFSDKCNPVTVRVN